MKSSICLVCDEAIPLFQKIGAMLALPGRSRTSERRERSSLRTRTWPLVGIRLIFTGGSIAMLGMIAEAIVDVLEENAEEIIEESIAESIEGSANRA